MKIRISAVVGLLVLMAFKLPSEHSSLKKLSKLYQFIPQGTVYYHSSIDSSKMIADSVNAFMISPTEVTNLQYKEFLYSLKDNPEAYKENYPDTTVWNRIYTYNTPTLSTYFWHPAFHDYPVVGITKKQAQNYCKWLTTALAVTFPEAKIDARLPMRNEFIRAARGNKQHPYSCGISTEYGKRKKKYLCNHKLVIPDTYTHNSNREVIVIKGKPSFVYQKGSHYHVKLAKSYQSNSNGLYNMSGNVSELLEDSNTAIGGNWNSIANDVNIESEIPANEPSPEIGFRVVLELQ